MNEQFKKVNNPLFSAAVTGATLEEFSQNAVLLPARQKTPPATVKLSQDQILSDIFSDRKSTFHTQLNDQNTAVSATDSNIVQAHLSPSNIQQQNQGVANIVSNFSNTVNIEQSNNNVQGTFQPPPLVSWNNLPPQSSLPSEVSFQSIPPVPTYPSATFSPGHGILGQEQVNQVFHATSDTSSSQVLTQEPTNPQSVPLFPTSNPGLAFPPKPPNSASGSLNVFRRSGLKRPTYAQVPGLSTPVQPTQPFPVLAQHELNQSTVPFGLENSPNTNPSVQNYFKPIGVPPHTPNLGVPLSQPLPTYLSKSSSQNLQSPVMDAIPDSEVMESNIPGTIPSQYINNDNPANVNPTVTQVYRPVYHHWFFKKESENKYTWQPFSMIDSLALEHSFTSNDIDPEKFIATDGGRYDVNILRRQRIPVYWKGNPSEVRRCSWFHKSTPDGKLVPYEENVAAKLEEEFKLCFETNQWHKKVELANGETIMLHGPDVLVLFPQQQQSPDAWGNPPNQSRPRVVKRGMDEFDIDEGEPSQVDHILFMVHGIGSVCDFRFRPVEEVVDEFRNIALQLVQSHYKSSCEKGIVNRVEVLPISWHDKLHNEDTGIDRQLKSITLESIPKLRDFTNDTLLDILFYTSPVYCQNIVSAVGNELNRIYDLFKLRNPSFTGGVSLGGHSLGSLILFDLLCHQHPEADQEEEDEIPSIPEEGTATPTKKPSPNKRKMSRRISYMMGNVGTGQPQIHYPHLNFNPTTFFALGSPIGMFVIVRGLDTLGEKFTLPTCPGFFNIFHPYDPIAYRIDSLIHHDLGKLKPVLIPHHKGRKRMHLELKDTMARVGADLKQKVIDSMKSTWNSFYQLAMFHKQPSLEEAVDKTFQEQFEKHQEIEEEPAQEPANCPLGNLNQGRRVDHVLQEAPLEFINEYIFALHSHVCYWDSEDTVLFMLKEIYSALGATTDSQIPQQTMTIERPPPSPTSVNKMQTMAAQKGPIGMDPTAQAQMKVDLNPPPISGFIRKT